MSETPAEVVRIFTHLKGREPEAADAFDLRTLEGMVRLAERFPYGPPREARALAGKLMDTVRAIHDIYSEFFDEQDCQNAPADDCGCPCHTWSES